MRLIRTFVEHRLAANLGMALMVLAGVWAISELRVQLNPDQPRPYVNTQISWRGASAEDVEKLVTTPLEQQLKTIPDVRSVWSVTRDGSSFVEVEIEPDADVQDAVDRVKQGVSQIRSLPPDIEPPSILRPAPTRSGGGGAGHRQRQPGRTHSAGARDGERTARPRHRRGGVRRPADPGDRHPGGQPDAVRAGPHLRRTRRPAGRALHRFARRNHRRRGPLPPAAQPRPTPRRRAVREPAGHHGVRRLGAPRRHRQGGAARPRRPALHDGRRQAGNRPLRAPRHGIGLAGGGQQSERLSGRQAPHPAGRRFLQPLSGSVGLHPRRTAADRRQRSRRLGVS